MSRGSPSGEGRSVPTTISVRYKSETNPGAKEIVAVAPTQGWPLPSGPELIL